MILKESERPWSSVEATHDKRLFRDDTATEDTGFSFYLKMILFSVRSHTVTDSKTAFSEMMGQGNCITLTSYQAMNRVSSVVSFIFINHSIVGIQN